MTPLETLAELLAGMQHAELHRWVRSLAAREEARVDSFWSDLAGPRVFGERDSVATLDWAGAARASAQRALLLIAEDLELRGVASAESSAWLERQRSASR